MIHICSQCGALILEDVERCSFCDAPLAANDEPNGSLPAGLAPPVDGSLEELLQASLDRRAHSATKARVEPEGDEPEWRREVSRRLEEYRARRRRYHPDDSQTGLPFGYDVDVEEPLPAAETRVRPRLRSASRPRIQERVEICIQPELDFVSAPQERGRPQTGLVPVAGLAERRKAGAIDALFLVLAYGAFLGIFLPIGGHPMLEKMDAMVYLAAFFLFYVQYFLLFTIFAGATPGMQLRGLTIVRLDGGLPDTRQLMWRSFGYVLSGTTLMLGFLWAIWDEEHFTWQDRISQTYVSAALPLPDDDALEVRGEQRFAHK